MVDIEQLKKEGLDFEGFNEKDSKMIQMEEELEKKIKIIREEEKKAKEENELKIKMLHEQYRGIEDSSWETIKNIKRNYSESFFDWQTKKTFFNEYIKYKNIANKFGVNEKFIYKNRKLYFNKNNNLFMVDVAYNEIIDNIDVYNKTVGWIHKEKGYNEDEKKINWNNVIQELGIYNNKVNEDYIIKLAEEDLVVEYGKRTLDSTVKKGYSGLEIILLLLNSSDEYEVRKYKIYVRLNNITFRSEDYKYYKHEASAINRYNYLTGKSLVTRKKAGMIDKNKSVQVKSYERGN
jgi:hypothetical protein